MSDDSLEVAGPEETQDQLTLELERLNTLLATTENSLREMQNERNRERILREKYEKEIVLLKGDVNRVEREKDELAEKLIGKEGEIAKADHKRRQAVERAEGLKAELDTLRRTKSALERQVDAADEAVLDAAMNGPRPAESES